MKAVFESGCAFAVGHDGMDGNVAELASVFVVTGDVALIITGVDDERVARIGSDVAGFTAADGIPILTVDGAIEIATGDGDGGVVLLRAVDVIREAIIGGDVIELRGGLIIFLGPVRAAVEGDSGSAVVLSLIHISRPLR